MPLEFAHKSMVPKVFNRLLSSVYTYSSTTLSTFPSISMTITIFYLNHTPSEAPLHLNLLSHVVSNYKYITLFIIKALICSPCVQNNFYSYFPNKVPVDKTVTSNHCRKTPILHRHMSPRLSLLSD